MRSAPETSWPAIGLLLLVLAALVFPGLSGSPCERSHPMSQRTIEKEDLPRRQLLSALGVSVGAAALAACAAPGRAEQLGTTSAALTHGTNVESVDVIAELAVLPGDIVGSTQQDPLPSVAIVQGFAVPGDGGGGVFAWVPDSVPPLTEDGGTIIRCAAGNGSWVRIFSGAVDVRWFGATMNDDTAGATNSTVLQHIQEAIFNGNEVWGHSIFIPPGALHLADDLHVFRAIELFGTGIQGESRIVMAPGKSVIVDPVGGAPNHSGTECVIRDIQIISGDNWTATNATPFNPDNFSPGNYEGTCLGTPGIVLNAPATLARVCIIGFSGTGVYVYAGGTTNANQWRMHDLYVSMCGGHGIHVDGGETQGGFCSGAKAIAIGGNGIYESSFGGNTYVGCYTEYVIGRGYSCDTVGQATFVGCFAEAAAPSRLLGAVFIGGNPGYLTSDTVALIAPSVVDVKPFNINNIKGTSTITTHVGVDDASHAPLGWRTSDDGAYFWQRWSREQQAWIFERHGSSTPAGYVTGSTDAAGGSLHPRGAGVQGFPWILLGSNPTAPDTGKPAIRITTSPSVPDWDPDDDIWHVGDRIFNTEAAPGAADGWVCVVAGSAFGPTPTAQFRAFGTIAT
jgi:hypothetical protein